jgi:tripartite ATP-independent transporter DctM subunit
VSAQWVGVIGMAALVVLIMIRIPVAVALALVGVTGYATLEGWHKAFAVMGGVPLELGSGYALSVVPLFALMGALATTAGLSSDLFRAANVAFAGLRGALAMATIGACAAFGAVCGSSLATAATMSRVSIPEMRDAGYHPRLAAGAVAAGGTLGILIPPSLILLIYAIIAQQSVTKLFAAALIPGIVLTVLYIGVIAGVGMMRPDWAPKPPPGARSGARGSIVALLRIWHIALLFLLVLGGIYLGWFSPTEAAAIGAFGALALGVVLRKIGLRQAVDCFAETIRISGSLFLIVMGSIIFSYFIVQTKVSVAMIEWIKEIGVGPILLMALLVVFYIVLGCFLEGIGMILVTVPIFFPLVVQSGFDPVWFGVLLVIVVEIGLIHPPVGMNLFVLRAQAPEISLGDMYMGVLPFLVAPFALIILLIAFPEIALWLPAQIR